jgi:hypothetical protein
LIADTVYDKAPSNRSAPALKWGSKLGEKAHNEVQWMNEKATVEFDLIVCSQYSV